MPSTKTPTRFALALLAATCLTPVGAAQAAPGDPIGPEFQVNTTTADSQVGPAVAMDADGDFVVAWRSCTVGDYDGCLDWDVFAQRYDAGGIPQGPEFPVNSTATGNQMFPAVAMDPDGNFVVAWSGNGPGDGNGVFAQRYNAAGEAQGPEFLVNGYTTSSQYGPAVAMDAAGDFVVVWNGYGPGDDSEVMGSGVFAQRYDSGGEPQSGEFRVNTTTANSQSEGTIAMDADGDFAVAWASRYQDGDNAGVFAQRYTAAGTPQGGEFQVNTTSAGWQGSPSLAMDAAGGFVVVWRGTRDAYVQRYNAAGEPTGDQIAIAAGGGDMYPRTAVAMDADGDFVTAWTDRGSPYGYTIVSRRYNAAGDPQGVEFQTDPHTSAAAVAMDADGDTVVAWENWSKDGDGGGIFAQRFDGAERVAGDFDGDGKADLLWRNPATGQTIVWLMDGDTKLAEGSIGTVPTAWEIAGTGDFNGDGKSDILWRHSVTGNAIVWQMNGLDKAASASIGAPPVSWSVEQLRDTDGDGLSDIVWRNTGTGSTIVWRMSGFTRVAADPIGSVDADWQLR